MDETYANTNDDYGGSGGSATAPQGRAVHDPEPSARLRLMCLRAELSGVEGSGEKRGIRGQRVASDGRDPTPDWLTLAFVVLLALLFWLAAAGV